MCLVDLHTEYLIAAQYLLWREKAKKALWFAETYGLVPHSLKMEDATGQELNMNLTDDKNQGTRQ